MGLFSGIGSAISGSFGDIAGAIGGVASTILGNNSAKNEASKNRDWQDYMSNTSVSRRMQDLRNAGLNPLLAVENASAGASTPSGSQAQLQQFNPEWLVALSNAKLQNAQAEKVQAEKEGVEKDNAMSDTRHELLRKEVELKSQNVLTEKVNQRLLSAETEKKAVEILLHQAQIKNVNMSTAQAYEIVRWQRFKNDAKFEYYDTFPNTMYGLALADDIKDLEHLGIFSNGFASVGTKRKFDEIKNGADKGLEEMWQRFKKYLGKHKSYYGIE